MNFLYVYSYLFTAFIVLKAHVSIADKQTYVSCGRLFLHKLYYFLRTWVSSAQIFCI
jgi:hypothetical protein